MSRFNQLRPFVFVTYALVAFTCVTTQVARAGQMSSHVYTALRSKAFLTGAAQQIVEANLPAYLAGAQGPDVTGVVMNALDSYSRKSSAGKETHYDPLKHHLAINLYDGARNDAERAYAIGWISHYINDIFIHAVINDYGGYYAVADVHHKELEQLETRYVLDVHKDLVTTTQVNQDYGAYSPTFAEFIFNGFKQTFPQTDVYANGDPAYFGDRFIEAGTYCTTAHKIFYATATIEKKKGKHGYAKETWKFPDMPTFDDYEAFTNALEIVNVKATKDKLTAKLIVHDNKGYGRFLADWEIAAEQAVDYARNTYALLSAYVAAPQNAKRDARKALLASVPSQNLDQPKDTFDPSKAYPGDKASRIPVYQVTFTPIDTPDNVKTITGKALSELKVKKTRWAGTEEGELPLEIPVPVGAYPYDFELKVATFDLNDLKRPDYVNRAWSSISGSSDTTGSARVVVGDIFTTSITLPPQLRNLPGVRQWIVLDEEPNSNRILMNGKVKGELTQFTLSRQSVGMLPGNREFVLPLARHRYDVNVIEDKRDGAIINAKLQITNPSLTHHLGPVWLAVVFLDHPQSTAMESFEAYRAWNEVNKKTKPVWDAVDARIASLSATKRNSLQKKAEAYEATLDKQNLPEQEKESLMEKKMLELLGTVGLKLTVEQKKLLADAATADQNRDAKSNVYNCSFGKFLLIPAKIKLDLPDGWKDEQQDDARNREDGVVRRELSKSTKMTSSDGSCAMSATASISITVGTDEKMLKAYKSDTQGLEGAYSTMTIGDFTGDSFESSSESSGVDTVTRLGRRDYLLKKGGVYVRVHISVNGTGYRITDNQGTVAADGRGAARSTAMTLSSEAQSIATSFRLLPGPVPDKKLSQ
jgi:hypothetical protein